MGRLPFKLRFGLILVAALPLLLALACGGETIKEVTVVVEKPVEKVVQQTVVVEKQVPVEKVVKETVVVEKQVPVEKVVQQTVVVEKQVPVEKVVKQTVIVEKKIPMPVKFSEAPMLTDLVKAGKLPPLEQRLPASPLVRRVRDGIGKYGGTWHRAFKGPSDSANAWRMWHSGLLNFTEDGSGVVPYVAESITASDDLKEYTIRLRRGLKWSDGVLFTADDIMFWYEDMLLNKELFPSIPSWMAPQGKPGRVEKIDDLTVKFIFDVPYGIFPEWLAQQSARKNSPAQPAHWLKQFHPKYADPDKLAKLVKDSGLESWTALFNDKIEPGLDVGLPMLDNWIPKTSLRDKQFIMERNPYYFGVDPQGNQLPYIDRIVMDLVSDWDAVNVKGMAGELDMQCRGLRFANYPVIKEKEKAGDYRTALAYAFAQEKAEVTFNQSYRDDPVIAELLQNKEFRHALSYAINREKINELVFLGLGSYSQQTLPEDNPYNPGDDYATQYTEYNPDLANQMLDKILPDKNAAGFRLRPDGKELVLVLDDFGKTNSQWEQLLVEDWAKVGVKATLNITERSVWTDRLRSNKQQVIPGGAGGWIFMFTYPYWTTPYNNISRMGPAMGDWYQSRGKTGIEPTGDLRRLLDILDEGQTASPEHRAELGRETLKILDDELYMIGIVAQVPGVCIVKNNMGNVPDRMANNWAVRSPGNHRTETFFFKD